MLTLRQTHGHLGQATNHEPVVYKIDNIVFSIEFSCVNPIQGSFV